MHDISRLLTTLLLLISLLLCPGCAQSVETAQTVLTDDSPEYITLDNAYSTVMIELPEDAYAASSYAREGRIYTYCSSADASFFCVNGSDGGIIEKIDISAPISDVSADYGDPEIVFADGCLRCKNNRGEGTADLFRFDENGSLISSYTFDAGHNGSPYDIAYGGDGNIYLCGADAFTVLDDRMNCLYTARADETGYTAFGGKLQFGNGGNAVLTAYKDNALVTLTYRDGSLRELEMPEFIYPDGSSPGANQSVEVYFGVDRDCYFHTSDGIYAMNEGDSTSEMLLDAQNSSVSFSRITIEAILSPSVIYIKVADYLSGRFNPALLIKNDSETERRILIKAAAVGCASLTFLHESAAYFNQTGTGYHIEIIDYGDNGGIPGSGEQSFKNDLAAGSVPDIVVFGQRLDDHISDYMSLDIFCDLEPYTGGNLMSAAAGAYMSDGGLLRVPISMNVSALAAKSTLTSGSLTLDELYGIFSALGEGGALFSDAKAKGRLFDVALYDFVDYKNADCSFDSDAFARFVNFCDGLDEKTDPALGSLVFENGSYAYSVCSPSDAISNGSLAFLYAPLNTVRAFAELKLIFSGEYTLCGFPCADGNGAYIESPFTLSVAAGTGVRKGAVKYLSYLLSDEIQSSSALSEQYLPVTLSALNILLENDHYYYDLSISGTGFFISTAGAPSDEERDVLERYGCIEVELTDTDKAAVTAFFEGASMKRQSDGTIEAIVNEELDAYRGGSKTLSEAGTIIQDRVKTYLAERAK